MKTIAIILFVLVAAILYLFWRGAKYAYEHQDEIAKKEHEEQGWFFKDQ